MAVPYLREGARRAGTSLPSVTSAQSGTPSNPLAGGLPLAKNSRILASRDFRRIYDHGFRYSCSTFAAFYMAEPERTDGPRVGFTVSRKMGKAVIRNRLKRRLREAVRVQLALLGQRWDVVFNPRRSVLAAPFSVLEADVRRLFLQCGKS